MRAFVTAATLACAGCSLFLLDGLNEDEGAAADAGSDTGTGSGDGTISSDAPVSSDAPTDGTRQNDGQAAADPYGDAVKQDTPVGWWRLDDVLGATSASDSSANGVAATIQGSFGVKAGQPGAMARGTAFTFDGTGHLDLGDRFNFPSPNAYTFEAWAKSSVTSEDNEYHGIFTKIPFGVSSKGPGRWMYFSQDGYTRIALEQWTATESVLFVNSNQTLPSNRFAHLVVAFDGANARIYVDGQLIKTAAPTGTVGNAAVAFKWGDGWKGALDELAIYDKGLDEARVLAHYAAAQPSK